MRARRIEAASRTPRKVSALCTAAGVGTLVERVERAYGDGLSAAVVAIVALAVVGDWS